VAHQVLYKYSRLEQTAEGIFVDYGTSDDICIRLAMFTDSVLQCYLLGVCYSWPGERRKWSVITIAEFRSAIANTNIDYRNNEEEFNRRHNNFWNLLSCMVYNVVRLITLS